MTILKIFILSLLAMSIWLLEILNIKGWYSLNWLEGKLYSPYIGVIIAATAFVIPFFKEKQIPTGKFIISIILLSVINLLCFEGGKRLCYVLYCRFCFWTMKDIILIFSIAFLLFVFIGFAFWFVTNKLIRKNKKINLVYISLLILSVIPLSLLTININTGFGKGTNWIDAVKMGYPIFWATMMLGLSGIIIARQNILQNK